MKNFDSTCALVPDSNGRGVAAGEDREPQIFWHRELPPLEAVPLGEGYVEATSVRVPGPLSRHDQLWAHCFRNLMDQTTMRMRQEVRRLGGRYAHVLEESIASHHDDATGEGWLAGRFRYTLLR